VTKYLEVLGNQDLLQTWKILNKKFTYSVTFTKLVNLRQEPKESLDHFTKKIMLLNILKRSGVTGAPVDERNKIIFFLNFLKPRSLNRKIEGLRDRVPAPDLDQCIHELGQQLLRQQVARENSAASESSMKYKSYPSWRQRHDTEANKSEVIITSNPRQSLAEKWTGIVYHPVPPCQRMAPVCFNCDSSSHLPRDCRAARDTCPICDKEGNLEKYHEASVRVKAYLKARHKEHQQSDKKVSKAETIMDSDGWSYSYMCHGNDR